MPVLIKITPARLPSLKINDRRSGKRALMHSPEPTPASTTAIERLRLAQLSCVRPRVRRFSRLQPGGAGSIRLWPALGDPARHGLPCLVVTAVLAAGATLRYQRGLDCSPPTLSVSVRRARGGEVGSEPSNCEYEVSCWSRATGVRVGGT